MRRTADMAQQYGEAATITTPDPETTSTQRYEQMREAANRAMSTISIPADQAPTTGTQPPATGTQPTTTGTLRTPAGWTAVEPDVDPELLSYRGFKFGAAFFGWLIAIAMSVLLLAAVSAAALGTAQVLDYTSTDAKADPGAAAITAAAVAVFMLSLAFYAGGYVAGRLARFDGGRQGFGVWMIALLVSVLAAGGGALLNNQYDLIADINRPDVALSNDTLTMGGIIAAATLVLLTLMFAILGGKAGQRYHDKIDRLLD
ncbi:hypothetical protein OG555_01090 [Kribbella sp. NBC_01484]|uniref:hypothetical protein n=1 Tax=Kribbella sp. NBC_01484 TaxID=2903579 RepID=UPI002E3811B0|nr:hypothetical protein [Kribbella sp. NBC_01484]